MELFIAICFALFFIGYGVLHVSKQLTLDTLVAVLALIVGVYQLIQLF